MDCKRNWVLLAFLVATGWSTSLMTGEASAGPNPKQNGISVDVNLVDLPVSVFDRNGHFATNLQKDAFQVYEDRQLQKISIFEQQDLPVTVGLVVDHSGSMGPKLAHVTAAAMAFAESSNPQDQLFVVNFNEVVALALPAATSFTSDQQELRTAVAGSSARGETALYDALIEALNHLKLSEQKRQALIVVTDGGDNASQHTLSQLLAIVQRSSAQIYSIGLYDENDADARPGVLKKLARLSGGEAYFPTSVEQVAGISKQIAADLREQYTLGFAPSGPGGSGGLRTIRVTVSAPNRGKLTVRTRSNYFLPAPKMDGE